MNFVFDKLDEGMDIDTLTETVTREAMRQGSMDNISATVVIFDWES